MKPDIEQRLEAYIKRLRSIIKRHGWAVQTVLSNPSYSYTIGLTQGYNHPEIVVMGLSPQDATSVLNSLAKRLTTGEIEIDLTNPHSEVVGGGYQVRFRALPERDALHYLKVATRFAGGAAPVAWQLVFPDEKGRFVDDPLADPQNAWIQDLRNTGDSALH